jgi:hypothetical protein
MSRGGVDGESAIAQVPVGGQNSCFASAHKSGIIEANGEPSRSAVQHKLCLRLIIAALAFAAFSFTLVTQILCLQLVLAFPALAFATTAFAFMDYRIAGG